MASIIVRDVRRHVGHPPWQAGVRGEAVSADKHRDVMRIERPLQRLPPGLDFPVPLGISGLLVHVLDRALLQDLGKILFELDTAIGPYSPDTGHLG